MRNLRERLEGQTYDPNSTIINRSTVQISTLSIANFDSNIEPSVVFVDTETTSFHSSADIIQLGAKSKDLKFSVNILPKQRIDPRATDVYKLLVREGKLFRTSNNENGQIVYTEVLCVSMFDALHDFYKFLYSLGQK